MKYLKITLLFTIITISNLLAIAQVPTEENFTTNAPDIEIISKRLEGTKCFLRNSPSGAPLIIIDGICMNLSDSIYTTILAFPHNISLNDVYWDENGNCYLSDGKNLYFYDMLTGETIKLVTGESFNMNFRGDKDGVLFYPTNSHDLYSLEYESPKRSIFWHFDDAINNVKKESDGCIVSYGNRIAAINKEKLLIPIEDSKNRVNAIETTDDGSMFYGTDVELSYIDGSLNKMTVIKKGVKDILYNNDTLYVLFSDNCLARINHVSTYRLLSDTISNYRKEYHAHRTIVETNIIDKYNTLIGAGEIHLTPNQLSIIPHHGIYAIIGNEMISLEENDEIPFVIVPELTTVEEALYLNDDLLVKNDTLIIACSSTIHEKYSFDTNRFQMFPTVDNNLFVLTKHDTVSMLYYCGNSHNNVIPYIKLEDNIIFAAGDTTQCIVVTQRTIYSIQDKQIWPLLEDNLAPIKAATFTKYGLAFATENDILLLKENNRVILIAKNECRKLLSDENKLYAYSDDGTLVVYNLDVLKDLN